MPSPSVARFEDRVEHREYLWARLPFLPSMARSVARRRPSAASIARRLVELCPLVLDHLMLEETALTVPGRTPAVACIAGGVLHEHLAIANAVHEIRASVERWSEEPEACDADRRLVQELALVDLHVSAQIALEEELLYSRL